MIKFKSTEESSSRMILILS